MHTCGGGGREEKKASPPLSTRLLKEGEEGLSVGVRSKGFFFLFPLVARPTKEAAKSLPPIPSLSPVPKNSDSSSRAEEGRSAFGTSDDDREFPS